jgi:hypothetical protein
MLVVHRRRAAAIAAAAFASIQLTTITLMQSLGDSKEENLLNQERKAQARRPLRASSLSLVHIHQCCTPSASVCFICPSC